MTDLDAPTRGSRRDRVAAALLVTVSGLAVSLAATGAAMWARGTPDLALLGALRVHIRVGLVAWPLFLFATVAGGLGRTHPAFLVGAVLLSLASVPFLIFSAGYVPMELAVTAYAMLLSLFAVLFCRRQAKRTPEAGDWSRIVAVGWPLGALALASGTYLGVFKSLGTISNVLNHVHLGCAGLLAVLALSSARRAAPLLGRAPAFAYQLALAIGIPVGLTWLGAALLRDRAGIGSGAFAAVVPVESVNGHGGELDPARFAALGQLTRPSAGCGLPECHLESHQEWAVSAHRFSATNRVYRHAVESHAKRFGWEATSVCAPCHDPLVARLGGHEGTRDEASERLRAEGVNCVVCHTMDRVEDPIGGGRFELRIPEVYLADLAPPGGLDGMLEQEAIYHFVRPHRANFMRPLRKRAELCGSCHQDAPSGVAAYHPNQTYSEWRATSYATRGIGCRECHMHMFELDWEHPPWDHHLFGRSTSLAPLAPEDEAGDPELARAGEAARQWLAGTLAVRPSLITYLRLMGDPQVEAYTEHYAGKALLELSSVGGRLIPGATTDLELSTRSDRIGHAFPTAVRAGEEIWLEVIVTDSAGRRIFATGAIGDGDPLPESAMWLGSPPGPPDPARGAGSSAPGRRIEAEHELVERVSFAVPDDARAPLTVRARWRYRGLAPWLARETLGPGAAPIPIQDLATVELDWPLQKAPRQERGGALPRRLGGGAPRKPRFSWGGGLEQPPEGTSAGWKNEAKRVFQQPVQGRQ